MLMAWEWSATASIVWVWAPSEPIPWEWSAEAVPIVPPAVLAIVAVVPAATVTLVPALA